MGLAELMQKMKRRSKENACPSCGEPLILAEETEVGLVEEPMWDSIYETFFIPTRRKRYVCMNKKCSCYFMTTHKKFLTNLLGDKKVPEHFFDEALFNFNKDKKKGGAKGGNAQNQKTPPPQQQDERPSMLGGGEADQQEEDEDDEE